MKVGDLIWWFFFLAMMTTAAALMGYVIFIDLRWF